jgi:hypothetical protein
MNKFCLMLLSLLLISLSLTAQTLQRKKGMPCYTKQLVDSVNAVSLSSFNALNPNMINWFVYEGQDKPLTLPANIVNVIHVKLDEKCPIDEIKIIK